MLFAGGTVKLDIFGINMQLNGCGANPGILGGFFRMGNAKGWY